MQIGPIAMETTVKNMPIRIGAHQREDMEVNGEPVGEQLKNMPKTVKTHSYAHNVAVEIQKKQVM